MWKLSRVPGLIEVSGNGVEYLWADRGVWEWFRVPGLVEGCGNGPGV